MELYKKKQDCFGCGACQAVCRVGAISMEADQEGFVYPVINPEICTGCGSCQTACKKVHEITGEGGAMYAVRCCDEALLQKSTSGGAFSLLADLVLESGGLVCGACFDEDFQVIHKLSDDAAPMRKAKYVQSSMTSVFPELEQALKGGRTVLFSGTPCQCQAVGTVLEDYRAQLILVSLVCRGVQSPKLWNEYVAYLEREGTLTTYEFRNKSFCNDAHTVAYQIGEEVRKIPMNQDRFSRLYIKCLTLRPSCYSCPFCRTELAFDFTIGDFWGIEQVCPDLADGKGTSLVIARGDKAAYMMEQLKEQAVILGCKEEDGMQPALCQPAKETILRKLLFKDLAGIDAGTCDMAVILKKYGA